MLLVHLAERALRIRIDAVPDEALETARVAILDTLGVTLAGSRTESVLAVRRALGPSLGGSATLFGDSARASALDAATINGTASHALDFDDCSNTMGGILPRRSCLRSGRSPSSRAAPGAA